MMITGAIIAKRRKQYIRIFRETGATTPGRAINPADYDIRQSLIFQKMVRDGVFVETGNGRYYLDEAAELRQTAMRRKLVLVILVAVLIIWLVSALLAARFY